MDCRRLFAALVLVLLAALPAAASESRHQTAEIAVRQRDFDRAAQIWQELARAGDAKAAYRLSGLYRSGRGVVQDLERSKFWLAHAKRRGYEAAVRMPALRTARFRTTNPQNDLWDAIERGDLQAAQAAIRDGASPDRGAVAGRCPVAEAILRGHVPIVRLLLAAGAESAVCPDSDRSLLHDAVESGEVGAVVALLRAGAGWKRSGPGRSTALHAAVRARKEDVLEALLRAGHPLDDRDAAGRTPLDLALVTQQTTSAKVLRAAGARKTRAATRSAAASPDWLVAAARDATARIHGQWPVLSVAAWRGQKDVVAGLLADGHDPNVLDPEGRTPIARAASAGHLDCVRLLLAAAADPNDGELPALVAAAAMQDVQMASTLLAAGADVDGVDPAGASPLHHAAGRGESGLVELLLEQGSLAGALDRAGESPLDRAIREGHAQLVPLLAPRVGDELRLRVLCRAVRRGDIEHVGALLESTERVTEGCDQGQHLLHLLAHRGATAPLEQLLARGARSDPRTPSGNTPLLLAARAGHARIVSALILHGAEIDVRDSQGGTPLMRAAAAGHSAIVVDLLAAGADRWIRNDRGETALDFARKARRQDIERVLEGESSGSWLP